MKPIHGTASFTLALLLALVTTARPAAAAPVTLANPSFENPILSDGVHSTSVPGWAIITGNTSVPVVGTPLTDAVTTYNPTAANFTGATGNNPAVGMLGGNTLDLSGGLVGLTGAVTQVVASLPITLGSTYTFTIAVGAPANDAFHGYNIALTAGQGGVILSSVSGTGVPSGTFTDVTVSYTPNALDPLLSSVLGTSLTIQLSSQSLISIGASSVDYDNARLDVLSVAPEPSTWATMLGGAMLLVIMRQCSKRTA